MSDAVNVMVYASLPSMNEEHEEDLMDVVRRECCPKTVQRIMLQKATIVRVHVHGLVAHRYTVCTSTCMSGILLVLITYNGTMPSISAPLVSRLPQLLVV